MKTRLSTISSEGLPRLTSRLPCDEKQPIGLFAEYVRPSERRGEPRCGHFTKSVSSPRFSSKLTPRSSKCGWLRVLTMAWRTNSPGDFGRLGQAAAGHHRAAQGRGEGVTRAMNHVWQLLMSQLDLAGNTSGSAGHIVDDFAIAMVDALQHHVLGTQLQQSTKQLVNRGLTISWPG